MEKIFALCAMYVIFMWSMFLLDNMIFLILRLFKKEQKSNYVFADVFMQRGKDTEVIMAVVNIAAHIGFAIWIIDLL